MVLTPNRQYHTIPTVPWNIGKRSWVRTRRLYRTEQELERAQQNIKGRGRFLELPLCWNTWHTCSCVVVFSRKIWYPQLWWLILPFSDTYWMRTTSPGKLKTTTICFRDTRSLRRVCPMDGFWWHVSLLSFRGDECKWSQFTTYIRDHSRLLYCKPL